MGFAEAVLKILMCSQTQLVNDSLNDETYADQALNKDVNFDATKAVLRCAISGYSLYTLYSSLIYFRHTQTFRTTSKARSTGTKPPLLALLIEYGNRLKMLITIFITSNIPCTESLLRLQSQCHISL